IYRRSLCFLLALASSRVFPDRRLVIGHSLGKGYYYEYDRQPPVTEAERAALEEALHALVREDLPIERVNLAYAEAVDHFKRYNQPDTVLLLEHRNDAKIPVTLCGGYIDIFHGPLVPRTGVLTRFELITYPPGMILRYPPVETPTALEPFQDNPLLFSVYREHKHWGRILHINCIGLLNEKIKSREIREFIEVAEALHDKKIAETADQARKKLAAGGVILIAGPSSSGKTTFSKKLGIQLKVLGVTPVNLSLDDYYVSRLETPRDEDGNLDFENIDALDIDKLNQDLVALLSGEKTDTPIYDFKAGARKEQGRTLKLGPNSLLVIEGIHGLNDALTRAVPPERKFKVYVSALTQLNLDDHNRIPTTDVRLIRRMVRDNQFRGYTALDTFRMWPSVRRGEDRNIFPFQNNADTAFNSSLDYELAVLKVYSEPLLKTVKPDAAEYHEARRLLSFLTNVIPLPPLWIPPQSILREFIGESGFSY
ncbi:MAG TPA: nucleoside kinase, partial [Spirochaetia bacterium]|nr:nucleoside kinase [Spirochaetia bacterium]